MSPPPQKKRDAAADAVIVLDDDSPPKDCPAVCASSAGGSSQSGSVMLSPSALSASLTPASLEEGLTSLAQWRGHLGKAVRVKAIVTSVVSTKFMPKKGVLRISVRIDDGSGVQVDARLSDALTEEIIELSMAEFQSIYQSDRAKAAGVLNKAAVRLAQFEGVFTLRFPASSPEEHPAQPPLVTLVSRATPSVDDLNRMMEDCLDALGLVL
jgi:hypothetical protein